MASTEEAELLVGEVPEAAVMLALLLLMLDGILVPVDEASSLFSWRIVIWSNMHKKIVQHQLVALRSARSRLRLDSSALRCSGAAVVLFFTAGLRRGRNRAEGAASRKRRHSHC